MSLRDVKDQEVACRLLTRMLERNRTPNGMLFWGPGGVGKRLAAIEFTKAVNCTEHESDACNTCLSCRKIANDNHPDVRRIVPADKTRLIKKQDIDEVNELASLRPFESHHRIFVFEDADRMNVRAQNHFLKTLEEPPGPSIFILLTEYPRILLPTIRSRCQMLRFRALRPETVTKLLVELRDLPRDRAEAIAGVAEGQMSRAMDLVDSEKRDTVLSLVSQLAQGQEPIELAGEFTKHLDGKRKQIEVQLKANAEQADPRDMVREEIEEQNEREAARLEALVKREVLEYLYLFQTWYRDELVFSAVGDAERTWNRDRISQLEQGPSSDPSTKILAIEQARKYLDLHVPEERVFRDLFFTLAEP